MPVDTMVSASSCGQNDGMSIRSLWGRSRLGRRGRNGGSPAPVGLDRERADVWSELADAVAGLGEGRSPEAVLADAIGQLRRASRAERAVVWLDVAGEVRAGIVDPPEIAVTPRAQLPAESATCAAVRYGGDRLAVIEVTDPVLGAGASRLVREVATAAASLVQTVAVREALRHHVAVAKAQRDQLREARSDLVTRQNAERRRVASDIHDGCQQRVTVIAAKIGLIRTRMGRAGPDDIAEAARLRAELDRDIEDLVGALSAVTSGRIPPRLDQSGLAAALRRDVGGLPLRVEVTGDPGPLPRNVEQSAYFCCLEAVQNAARHSGGRTVQVSLRRESAALVFTVSDDGKGFDTQRAVQGTGLDNIRRRVDEHGGRFQLVASDGGTRLTGWLPLVGSA
jgi:signal transduction histidine kinase